MAKSKKIIRKLDKNKKPYYINQDGKRKSIEDFAKQYNRLPPRGNKELTKDEKKVFAQNRVKEKFTPEKVERKSKARRLRIEGKFISAKVENELREFAKRNGVSVTQYLKENKNQIKNYVNNFEIINNYRPDTVITLINMHKGMLDVAGFELSDKKDIIRAITKLSNKLISTFGAELYYIEIRTSFKPKGKRLFIDLSELESMLKMKRDELAEFDSNNIIIHLA